MHLGAYDILANTGEDLSLKKVHKMEQCDSSDNEEPRGIRGACGTTGDPAKDYELLLRNAKKRALLDPPAPTKPVHVAKYSYCKGCGGPLRNAESICPFCGASSFIVPIRCAEANSLQ